MKDSGILGLIGAFLLSWTASVCAQEEHHKTTTDMPPQVQVAGSYTCPMHSEIRTDNPGRCPKCQMLLEFVDKEAGITVGAGAHTVHGSQHGGVLGMVGDYHLELVERDAEFRVYLYDAFTKPLSAEGLSGSLVYYAAKRTGNQVLEASETWLPLKPDPANMYLVAPKVPGPEPDEVTVMLEFQGEDLETTFPLRIPSEDKADDAASRR